MIVLLHIHDFFKTQEKRLRYPGVTLLRLWEAYHAEHPDGFKMTAFYRHFNLWKIRVHPSRHMDHKAGDKMFVDYTGEKLEIVDPQNGEVKTMEVFCGHLGSKSTHLCRSDRKSTCRRLYQLL